MKKVKFLEIYDWANPGLKDQFTAVFPLLISIIVAIGLFLYFKKNNYYKNAIELRIGFIIAILMSNIYFFIALGELVFGNYTMYKEITNCVETKCFKVITGQVERNSKITSGGHWELRVNNFIFSINYPFNLFTLSSDVERLRVGDTVRITYLPGEENKIIKLERNTNS